MGAEFTVVVEMVPSGAPPISKAHGVHISVRGSSRVALVRLMPIRERLDFSGERHLRVAQGRAVRLLERAAARGDDL